MAEGAMRKGSSAERRRYWLDLIERQPTSGLNITRFCAQAGVSQNSFYVWKRRLRVMVGEQRPVRRAGRSGKARAKEPSLLPVRLIPDVPATAQVIEVAWPSGMVLRIPTPCDTHTLHEVLRLLAATFSSQSPAC